MERAIVAIPSTTPAGLEAPRSQHFGRAEYFIVVRVEQGSITHVRAVANQPEPTAGHGSIARALIDEGLTDIITSGMGAGMYARAVSAQVGVWIDQDSCTVGESMASFLSGSLVAATEADIHAEHHTA
ncbi:MAG: NifB/NifX family molybdenum-iron cluster-binding protein [Coriobacteriia bacterium]|nr:NifB/NifX family molybdenum-iron cluster-binding protein [Coriobacteriia bacterium]MDO9108908.1 NifB/NifX family molybdenum-iron cluster-binding protein [Coriobacteriia bacterium]